MRIVGLSDCPVWNILLGPVTFDQLNKSFPTKSIGPKIGLEHPSTTNETQHLSTLPMKPLAWWSYPTKRWPGPATYVELPSRFPGGNGCGTRCASVECCECFGLRWICTDFQERRTVWKVRWLFLIYFCMIWYSWWWAIIWHTVFGWILDRNGRNAESLAHPAKYNISCMETLGSVSLRIQKIYKHLGILRWPENTNGLEMSLGFFFPFQPDNCRISFDTSND